ncbi:MAG: site-2 protease family protein [Clostridiaceae bacterium]|nr:site-2 protease family protein [Clostridiaceae bacterium]
MPIVALSGLLSRFTNFNLQDFLITILVLCISLSFHEMANAWAAYRLGDDTAALQGRLSMNPLAHLDPIGTITFIIGGIGWARPVPINPARFDHKYTIKKGMMLTSVAGPVSNLILAVAAVLLYYICSTIGLAAGLYDNTVLILLQTIMLRFYTANLTLAIFNLLPIPPLDGFKVFGILLPNGVYYKLMSYERYIGLAFLLLVLFGGGILSTVLSFIANPLNHIICDPIDWLFRWFWRTASLI